MADSIGVIDPSVFTAVSGSGPGISQVIKGIQGFRNEILQAIKGMKEFRTAVNDASKASNDGKWFDNAISNADKLSDKMKKAKESMDNLVKSGKDDIAMGKTMSKPLVNMVKSAGDIEDIQVSMQMAGISKENVDALTKDAQDTRQKTTFDTSQVLNIDKSLAQTGMDYSKIKSVGKQATYLAQLEADRNGANPVQTAKQFAQMTERLNISMDPAKVKSFADEVNRIATATGTDVSTLSDSSKYFNLTEQIPGLKSEDIMMTQGLASKFGIDESIGGSHMKDFFQSFNPSALLGNKNDAEKLEAFSSLGWLKDVKRDKEGNITSFSGDSFHDTNGNLVGADKIFGILGEAYKKTGNTQQTNTLMTKALGQQGQDVASAVSKNPEAFSSLKQKMGKIPGVEDGIQKNQEKFNQQFKAFSATLGDFGRQMGATVLPNVTAFMKKMNDALPAIQKFIDTHKPLIKNVLTVWAGLAGLKIGGGMLKIAVGGPLKELFNFGKTILDIGKFGLKAGRGIKGFTDAFKHFREVSGVLSSLWKALAFGHPTLLKVTSMFKKLGKLGSKGLDLGKVFGKKGLDFAKLIGGKGLDFGKLIGKNGSKAIKKVIDRFKEFGPKAIDAGKKALKFGKKLMDLGAKALIGAARMASAWVIGLGPVGWIIIGIIAVVALLAVAWKRNWGHIQDHTKAAVKWIRDHFNSMIDWFKGLPDKMPQIGKDIVNGLLNGIKGNGGGLKDELTKFASKYIPEPFKKALGINSPSRVMAEQGKFIVMGLANGIMDNGRKVKDASVQMAQHVLNYGRPGQLEMAYAGASMPTYYGNSTGSYQDKRNIILNIYAKDENEAYQGVKRALDIDDKYISSRNRKRRVWDQ